MYSFRLLAIEEFVTDVAFRHSSSVLLYEEKEHFQKSSEPAKSGISIVVSGVMFSLGDSDAEANL